MSAKKFYCVVRADHSLFGASRDVTVCAQAEDKNVRLRVTFGMLGTHSLTLTETEVLSLRQVLNGALREARRGGRGRGSAA